MDKEGAQNFLNQFFSLWIAPELQTRKTKTSTTDAFSIDKAQVLFTLDGRKVIRLNDEVQATIKTNKRQITDMSIDTYESEETIERLDRIPEEENFGHTTVVKIRNLWVIAFDFRYGIDSSRDYYDLSKEFLDAAKSSLKVTNYHAATSNLYIAMEHLARARILLYPDLIVKKSKKHTGIAGQINVHANKTQVIKPSYAKTFNYIQNLYNEGVRYMPNMVLDIEEIKGSFAEVELLSTEILTLYRRVPLSN